MSGHLWEENPGFTLFGGMGFFDETPPPEWDSFGKIRFVLPLLEFHGTKRHRTIVLNVVIIGISFAPSCRGKYP
jgi:hypothetical protein